MTREVPCRLSLRSPSGPHHPAKYQPPSLSTPFINGHDEDTNITVAENGAISRNDCVGMNIEICRGLIFHSKCAVDTSNGLTATNSSHIKRKVR